MEKLFRTNEGGKHENIQRLQNELESAGIDISKWGTGVAKTLEHLQKEIEAGETILEKNDQGELLRKVFIVDAEVFYMLDNAKRLKLREAKQVFADGQERTRNFNASILEKTKPGEDPQEAILRGLKEELGIVLEDATQLEAGETEIEITDSQSYPNLRSEYTNHHFTITLQDDAFNPEGYIEYQPDKTTFFTWEEYPDVS
jgi:hypothetical protein